MWALLDVGQFFEKTSTVSKWILFNFVEIHTLEKRSQNNENNNNEARCVAWACCWSSAKLLPQMLGKPVLAREVNRALGQRTWSVRPQLNCHFLYGDHTHAHNTLRLSTDNTVPRVDEWGNHAFVPENTNKHTC